MNKYQRVTFEVRCQISAYKQASLTVPEIAKLLKFHKSTIYREVKRNSQNGLYHRIYNPSSANMLAKQRFASCRRKAVVHGELEEIILTKLKKGWSPDLIAGRLKKEKHQNISHQTIYRFIYAHPDYKSLLRRPFKRGGSRMQQRNKKPEYFNSIHDRPNIVEGRKRFGDWERDGMYGANKKQLLICVERKSRFTKIAKMPGQLASAVGRLTLELIRSTLKPVHTITNDNGTEFRGAMESNIPVYFCDPQKPQQRGTIENTIGILRRFISVKTDLDQLSQEQIQSLEDNINSRPRKILDYQTPYEVLYQKRVALAF